MENTAGNKTKSSIQHDRVANLRRNDTFTCRVGDKILQKAFKVAQKRGIADLCTELQRGALTRWTGNMAVRSRITPTNAYPQLENGKYNNYMRRLPPSHYVCNNNDMTTIY
jgi:hypothetical protein